MAEDQDVKATRFSKFKTFCKDFIEALGIIFGVVRYQAPPWIRNFWTRLTPKFQTAGGWTRRHRKQLRIATGLSILLALLGYAAWDWQDRQPKPLQYTCSGNNPPATPLFEGAKTEPLRINFSGSVARIEQVGKAITKGIRISPALSGEWKWPQADQLIFTPKEDWAVGQDYVVTFEKTLFPEFVRLEKYEHRFSTAKFEATFVSQEFYQDPKQPKTKKVIATIRFTHPVDSTSFEQRVALTFVLAETLTSTKSPLKHTVSYDKFKGEAYIQSDLIPIPLKDSHTNIKLHKGIVSTRGGAGTQVDMEKDVQVPGMYSYFRVNPAHLELVRNEKFEPEQVMMLEFTAPVHPDEVMKHLSMYILPVDKPAVAGGRGHKKHHWHSPEEIGPEILKVSEKLKLEAIPTELEFSKDHQFKYKAPPKRYVYIQFTKEAVSYGDYILSKTFDSVLRVPNFPKELKIMHDGSVLSITGSRKLSLLARNLEAIQIEMAQVMPGQINHLITQSGGNFSHPNFENYNFNEDNLAERNTEIRNLTVVDPGKTQYSSVDFKEEAGRGLFFLKISGWDKVNKIPTEPYDRRFILITDMGVLVKREKAGGQAVFVQSIRTGKPVGEAKVEVLGKNGVPVVSGMTGPDGQLRFPSLTGFERERSPVAYVVKKGTDISFLPYNRSDRELALSRFDVGGISSDTTGEKLSAYLFSDRGIYRPGDEFHVGMIVRSQRWEDSLSGIPLEVSITDPRGVEVHKQKIGLTPTGFEEISFQPGETSPTGSYQVNLYIIKDQYRGALLGYTTVRVEEFLPDRMRIKTRLSTERVDGWVKPDDLKGSVELKTLFGIAAANRNIRAEISLSPAMVAFRPFKEYQFHDPASTEKSFSERLGDSSTNDKGEAEFDLNLSRFEKSTYRLTFYAEGFEADGGRAVSAQSSVIISPQDYMVGFKADGGLNYLNQASERSVHFVAVNPELKPIAAEKLMAQLVDFRYVSALVKQPNGLYKYQSVRKERTLSKKPFSIPQTGLKYLLPTDQAGDYALILRDEAETQYARVEFSVAGKANLTRELEKNAELQLKLSKSDYSAGEEIELQIVAPYLGSGLITIEREKVFAHKWFSANTTSTVERIRLPAGIEGNAYVTVSFVRSIDSKEIFTSPLSYAAAPFSVSREARINTVTLNVPDRARPGEPFKIKFKTKKPGRIAVFAVDEGILQVARYKTPDPLSFFFQKRALEVTTSQILDQILPEFSLVKELAAPGGGEGEEALGKNLNPFKRKRDKPVAYWSGVKPATGEWQELTYNVPDYFNGSLQVMAVVVSNDSIGVDSKKSFIRGHFVITPSVPTFVSPGDEFTVGVAVANLIEKSGDPEVEISAETSIHLVLTTPKVQKVKIAENREASIHFNLKANEVLGSGTITIRATTAGMVSKASTDLSIRPAAPFITRLKPGHLKEDKVEIPVTRIMYPDYRQLHVALSHLPMGLARGLMAYLDTYPYLCTEQLVSKSFPLLALRQYPEFGFDAAKIIKSFDDSIRTLRARQNEEGAFGIWAANSHVSDFQTVYAAHFLTEAKEKNFPVPKDLLDRTLEYLKRLAGRDNSSLGDERISAYAIYILTRNGNLTSNYLASMQKRLTTLHKDTWGADLTAPLIAGAYQLLQKKDEAWSMLKRFKAGTKIPPEYADYYDGLVRDSLFIYILARHFPDRVTDLTPEVLLSALSPLWTGGYNTINSSLAILALTAYADATPVKQTVKAELDESGENDRFKPLIIPNGIFVKVPFSDKTKKLRLATKSAFPIFYIETEAGFDKKLPTQPIKENLEVYRDLVDSSGKSIDSIKLGEQVEVHLKMRTLQPNSYFPNVAVIDLLPGGFEVVLDTVRKDTTSSEESPQESGEGEAHEEDAVEGQGEGASHPPPTRVKFASPASFPVGTEKTTFAPEYVDVREDRVLVFGSIGPELKEFVYRIRATNEGSYLVPPTFSEGMYDRSAQTLSLGGKITVQGK